jgi:hypothetical protein
MTLPHTQNGISYSEPPQSVLPLKEGSGPEGSIHVHVPFSVSDIQQCREKLGRYTEEPDRFTIGFQTRTVGFGLSWRNVQFLLANCCTHTEREKILTAAWEVDEAFARDPMGQHPEDNGFVHMLSVELNFPWNHWEYFPCVELVSINVYNLNGLIHMLWYTQPLIWILS